MPGSWLPLLPLVAMMNVTSHPCAASLAVVPPAPNSLSSGCAPITRARLISLDSVMCCSLIQEWIQRTGGPLVVCPRRRSAPAHYTTPNRTRWADDQVDRAHDQTH